MDNIAGVNLAAVNDTDEVIEGSKVSAIFIEHWVKSFAGAGEDTKFQFCIEKVQTSTASITFAEMNNLMAYANKKNILFFSQGVIGDSTTQSLPVVRQWFKIPRGKQRFGLGDRLVATLSATAATIQNCGFATYKEQQ